MNNHEKDILADFAFVPVIGLPRPSVPIQLPPTTKSLALNTRVRSVADVETEKSDAHDGGESTLGAAGNSISSHNPPCKAPLSSDDVEVYLREMTEEIRRSYHLQVSSWPEDVLFEELARAADGSFVAARLIIRYLGDPWVSDPQSQLNRLISLLYPSDPDSRQLHRTLDLLYGDVVQRIPPDERSTAMQLVAKTRLMKLQETCLAEICNTLGLSEDEAYHALQYLHPVMSIPPPKDALAYTTELYDESFSEFFTAYFPSAQLEQPAHSNSSNPKTLLASRPEPCEDGKVRKDLSFPQRRDATEDSAIPLIHAIPIRRRKRGHLPLAHFDRLHDKYYQAGRTLKYSAEARFLSTYPPTSSEHRPLADPPLVNSLYHKHSGLIARLELVDALVCFAYSTWTRDYSRKTCSKETWKTMTNFLSFCKRRWLAQENTMDDAEKTFIGLIYMIESFIDGRKMFYSVQQELDSGMDRITEQATAKIAAVIEDDANTGMSTNNSQALPAIPPSPVSSSASKKRHGSIPSRAARPAVPSQDPFPQKSGQQGPLNPHRALFSLLPPGIRESRVPPPSSYLEAASNVTELIDADMICSLKDLTASYQSTASWMAKAQRTLNPATLARHFPTTFSRMVKSTLGPTEEHEPDFEDEEGELFWPGQLVTGEGLGWVCLMGKAMILEFGKTYGYKGLHGVIPKPSDAPKSLHRSKSPSHPQAISHSSSPSR